jgi:VWFA-related protein
MRRTFCVALLGGSLAASAVPSNRLSAQPQQPIRVGTNFVRVDVYPTRDGRIVDGLQAADFEVLEDGVPQKIETFEHVVATSGPQTARTEPASQREMQQALANPRARVFLLFLDAPFVDDTSARQINEPLIKFLTTELADDDLVGVMTPSMSASQVTFGKKTEVFAEGVRSAWWSWGRQNRDLDPELDRKQIQYTLCYPNTDVPGKMIARSRERATLEALQDAVKYLASLREERKAFVTVTEGWVLYREDPDLMRQRQTEQPLGVDKMRVGPTGKLTLEDHRNSVNALPPNECDSDRSYLAQIDDEKFLRDIIDDANRGNATFYMIDPAGLRAPKNAAIKAADHSGAMRTLAENTDGLAVLNTNDLDRGLNRIAEDMASYYLLGYYASNTKSDGRFREITVRMVNRPGIGVRARKGYRAPTAAEVTVARRAVESPAPSGTATSVKAAIDRLGSLRPNARLRVNAVVSPGPWRSVWVAGELQSTGRRPDEFMQGAKAAVEAIAGGTSATASVTLKSGELSFLTKLDLPGAPAGTVDVRVRLASDEGTAEPLSEGVRIDSAAAAPAPLMFRRSVTTGNRLLPAADPRFSRTERLRLEFPVGPGPRDGKPGNGRVIDRGGVATRVPVSVAERTEEGTGQRWITADVSLAPLSPGDYAIEVVIVKESKEERALTPIRVVR